MIEPSPEEVKAKPLRQRIVLSKIWGPGPQNKPKTAGWEQRWLPTYLAEAFGKHYMLCSGIDKSFN